jgi:CRISPR type I-A-associated protein Csa5
MNYIVIIYHISLMKNMSGMSLKKFTTDKTIHIKKVKKERVKIEYPTVKIFEKEGRRTCLVEFSPIEKNIAAFINTMTKKLQYGNSKKEIIFFSHSKKRI